MQVQLLQGKVPWAAPDPVHSGLFSGSVDWLFGAAQFCACGWPCSFVGVVLAPEETTCFAGCSESIIDKVWFTMPVVDGFVMGGGSLMPTHFRVGSCNSDGLSEAR